jgi:hypothetical protein
MKKLTFFCSCLCLLIACNEPEDAFPHRQEAAKPFLESSKGVFVLNEGNFGWGYGTVDYIDLEKEEVARHIYEGANGELLGNVLQSGTYFMGRYFLVVNNSQKVVAIDPQNFVELGSFTELPSPRYFLGISEEKAYVSDLYAKAIHIVNPSTFEKTGQIAVPGWTEHMILAGNIAIVASPETNELLLINTDTDTIEETIALDGPPNSLQFDKNNRLWVLTGAYHNQQAGLYRFSFENLSEPEVWHFESSNSWPGNLCLNPAKDTLYYLHEGVYQMSVDAESLPTQPLIEETDATLYYGLDISPAGDIWLADALDYVQNGWARQYSNHGVAVDSFRVGVIPNSFLFTNQ